MKFGNALSVAMIATVLAFGQSATAIPVSADFSVSLDLPGFGSGARVLEALNQPIGDGIELSDADELANPSDWTGHVDVDMDSTGLISVIGRAPDGYADYNFTAIDIMNIQFDAGETITGFVAGQARSVLDPALGDEPVAPALSFTGDSVTIAFGDDTDNEIYFEFLDGGVSTFQIETEAGSETTAEDIASETVTQGPVVGAGTITAVPVPAALPLFLVALGGLGFVSRRRKA